LNGNFGSNYDLRRMPAERLECSDEPTFTLEGRQCAGGQTYQTRSLKVRFVP
jgi:hypothetical protein